MINRLLEANIQDDWDNHKAIVVIGPRQVGKTTLIAIMTKGKKTLYLNGDNPETRTNLTNASFAFLQNLIADYDVMVID